MKGPRRASLEERAAAVPISFDSDLLLPPWRPQSLAQLSSIRRRMKRLASVLAATYGTPDLGNQADALDEAIYILLTYQTDLPRARSVWLELKRQFPSWESVLAAPAGELERVLAPSGFQRARARLIRQMLLGAPRGTTRDIQQHLRELYGTDVSPELISRATEGVMDEFRAWQSRPLEAVYPIVYLDALFVSVRDGGQVQKRAFYVALGVRVDGSRDVLGLWVAASEGSKFWLTILTELKNRGVHDILFICADGLTGLGQAIEAAFPKAVHQTCVVHLIRSALRFVSWSDRKLISASLRPVYHAENEQAAELALNDAAKQLDGKYPSVVRTFRNRWAEFVPFLSYPAELRRMLYTTNAVESLNSQLRKTLRQRGPFPNDEAVFKLLYLAIQNAKVHWSRPIAWTRMLVQLDIFFEGRLPA